MEPLEPNPDRLRALRDAVHRQVYIYRYALDQYRRRSHVGYVMLEVSSFISSFLNLLSLFTSDNGALTIVSAVATALIGIFIKVLQRVYPEEEMSRFSTHQKRLRVYLSKLSNPEWRPKPKQLQQLELLLQLGPNLPLPLYERAANSCEHYPKAWQDSAV